MDRENKGKKFSVIEDELKIKGGGLYCIFPFERIDRNQKAVFKIGLAINFRSRETNYHTYFPLGFHIVAVLANPPVREQSSRSSKGQTKLSKYKTIEKYIFDYIEENKGKIIHSTTRVNHPNAEGEGKTEWVYCDEVLIHEAFESAQRKFKGSLHNFYLAGEDENGNYTTINDIADKNARKKPNFVGTNTFKV